ncbi:MULTISPECIES: hypothetical protein [Cronobacter]|uniref:hypothetical protein n=1 Tax=Cronobacter TaxID=413496 RepID=UPI000A1E49E7|nr:MULTISPECIES: hypothetical protein [Cronobacter]AZP31611.1 hypothetical protein DC438_00035 [Cronobacter sakazakii]EJJ0549101.1 hypothetical protein [Cronobacter sakazakii]EKK5220258.1 hypothetical protein [Cronobacter sakazakii]EKM7176543.1 hypothetical protein [Cronobacter sakazakii]ELY2594305.1 hypothetical protein [Cronobacter sakazakii]
MKKAALFFLLAIVVCPLAQSRECSKEKAEAAENAVDNLKTWKAVYESYRRYSSCDEGSIGEGYSEAIIRLLADRWSELPALDALGKRSASFERWVLSHIDSTLGSDDLQKVSDIAKTQCPSGHTALCEKIAAAASKVINEG